jgi:hypothetical protein
MQAESEDEYVCEEAMDVAECLPDVRPLDEEHVCTINVPER